MIKFHRAPCPPGYKVQQGSVTFGNESSVKISVDQTAWKSGVPKIKYDPTADTASNAVYAITMVNAGMYFYSYTAQALKNALKSFTYNATTLILDGVDLSGTALHDKIKALDAVGHLHRFVVVYDIANDWYIVYDNDDTSGSTPDHGYMYVRRYPDAEIGSNVALYLEPYAVYKPDRYRFYNDGSTKDSDMIYTAISAGLFQSVKDYKFFFANRDIRDADKTTQILVEQGNEVVGTKTAAEDQTNEIEIVRMSDAIQSNEIFWELVEYTGIASKQVGVILDGEYPVGGVVLDNPVDITKSLIDYSFAATSAAAATLADVTLIAKWGGVVDGMASKVEFEGAAGKNIYWQVIETE